MKITVGIIALNEIKYLPALLEDVRRQTYPHDKIEVVLADSGSQDGTKECMREFKKLYEGEFAGVQVLENTGGFQSTGWNEIICRFTTDALIRVDAHSHIPPEFVEKNVENFESGEMVSGGRRPTLTEEEGGFGDTLLLAEESLIWKQYCLVPPEGRKSLCEVLFPRGIPERSAGKEQGDSRGPWPYRR